MIFQYVIRIGISLVLSFVISKINLDKLEFPLYDLRMKYLPFSSDSKEVVLIKIDPKTVEQLKHIPTASEHTIALRQLKNLARNIIYTLPITQIKGTHKELSTFAEELEQTKKAVILSNDLEMKGVEKTILTLPSPFQKVRVLSGPLTRDTKVFAKDGVTRRAMIEYQNTPLIHPIIAGLENHSNPLARNTRKIENVKGVYSYYDSQQFYFRYQKPGRFVTISFNQLLSPETLDINLIHSLKDKIVIIGTDLLVSFDEYAMTPMSESSTSMTISETHANIIDSLIQNNGIVVAPQWLNLLLVILISILVIEAVLGVKPLKGLLILITTLVLFTIVACLSFWIFGWWINMAQVYLSIFLTYYFFIPYRLIKENRRSWEYFQKHKLLTEVEALKTNFISMMSHDLKTPIARIQGMTEMISSDPHLLSSNQREALDMIKASGDDLLRFINAILQYGRIESQGVELNLQSKDINTLLEEVILKHEFLARLKHIQIRKSLEPLFPIQLDPDLIKQVFSNLIENAIKYSPEKTIIQVKSFEKDDSVHIQVIDQGLGIPADELTNIFTKFFRSRNAKNSSIKGSGLGLYLAKYFIELHSGTISVESSENVGSQFFVELPITHKKR